MRLYRLASAYAVHLFVTLLLSTSVILPDAFSSLTQPILGVSCATAGAVFQDGNDRHKKPSEPSCTKSFSYRKLQSPDGNRKTYYSSLKSDLPYSPVITASPTAKRVRFIEPLTDAKGNNNPSETGSEESRQGEETPRGLASPVAQVFQPNGVFSQTQAFSAGSKEELHSAEESMGARSPSAGCSTGSSRQPLCQKKPIDSLSHEEKPESHYSDS